MPVSTVPDSAMPARLRRARLVRRVYLGAIAGLVLLGLAGYVGPQVATASATGAGYTLTVEHPGRTRAGLPAELRITVQRDGGFTGPVTVGIATEYLEVFDDQGSMPQPASSTADARWVHLQFDPPPGEVLVVVKRLRVNTGAYRGREGAVAVFEAGSAVAVAELSTAVWP